jgi:hypothetical protein
MREQRKGREFASVLLSFMAAQGVAVDKAEADRLLDPFTAAVMTIAARLDAAAATAGGATPDGLPSDDECDDVLPTVWVQLAQLLGSRFVVLLPWIVPRLLDDAEKNALKIINPSTATHNPATTPRMLTDALAAQSATSFLIPAAQNQTIECKNALKLQSDLHAGLQRNLPCGSYSRCLHYLHRC